MPFFSLPTGGSPVLAGSGAPTGALGNVGDLFIDQANKLLYGPKTIGGWPTGPVDLSNGPTGPASTVTGPTGPAGSFASAQAISAQVTDYTLTLSDAGKLITFDAATGTINVVIPAAGSVPFATGVNVDLARLGDAGVSITGATGVTVRGTPGLKLRAKYSAGSVILYSGNTWLVKGDLSS